MSPHEECAVELAVQAAKAERRLGDGPDRRAPPTPWSSCATRSRVGCSRVPFWSRRTPSSSGPADVAHAIAAVVRDARAGRAALRPGAARQRRRRHRRLPGRHPAGLRARPSRRHRRLDGRGTGRPRHRRAPLRPTAAPRSSRSPLPAVITVMEGGVEPRYPSITGRMKAKKVERRDGAAVGLDRPVRRGCASSCRPASRARWRSSVKAPRPPRPWSTCWRSWECRDDLGTRRDRRRRCDRGVAGDPHVRPATSASRRARARSSATPPARPGRPAWRVRRGVGATRRRRRLRDVRRCCLGRGQSSAGCVARRGDAVVVAARHPPRQ